MSYASLRSVLLVSAMSIGLPSVSSATTLRKCGPQPPGTQPLFVLDGIIYRATDPALKSLSLDGPDIYSIEIRCLNPRDSTFTTGSGIGAVVITTKQGLTRDAKLTLTALLELQDVQFRRESRYLESIDGLALPQRHAGLQVVLEKSPNGWAAKAIVEGPFTLAAARRGARVRVNCFVYDGEQTPPQPGLRRRQVACMDDR